MTGRRRLAAAAAVAIAIAIAAALSLAACSQPRSPAIAPGAAAAAPVATRGTSAVPVAGVPTPTGVPRFDHVVIAVLENHAYDDIIGSASAPYLATLAASGAVLSQSYAITHPSEPNYLALFSGSTQGLSDDSCPHSYTGPNLAGSLLQGGHTFTGYSESLPTPGFTGCGRGPYARKHNPWVDFTALPASVNQPMTAFPADFTTLPTVSFVVPNLNDDMHDGSVAQGDQWLKTHLGAYADWTTTHNSLFVITADEDDSSHSNRIPTIIAGAHVRPGRYSGRTDHYGLLRPYWMATGSRRSAGPRPLPRSPPSGRSDLSTSPCGQRARGWLWCGHTLRP